MFFSVKKPLRILGKVYIPCICYPVTKVLEATVEKMVADGIAVSYEKEVGFMNGKVLEKKSKKKTTKAEKKVEEKKEEIVMASDDEVVDSTEGF